MRFLIKMGSKSYNLFKFTRLRTINSIFQRYYINKSHYSTQQEENSEAERSSRKRFLLNGPNLKDFFRNEHLKNMEDIPEEEVVPYLQKQNYPGEKRKVFFEVYGCQMNVNDTEIIWSILEKNDFLKVNNVNEADIVLIVTCAIREGAESKIWNRLNALKSLKEKRRKHGGLKIGILGCMAERLKHKVLEIDKSVDLVAGPDSYKDLPRLLALTENNQTAINVMLSLDETYADVMPLRLNENSRSAYISIMRGCDNMCTYCIVPFTRGRERSRPINSILDEVRYLRDEGVKEVTLLGQNVNSYRDISQDAHANETNLAKGFKTVYKTKKGGMRFADLLYKVAEIDPDMRIRFTSPHPKDFPDEVLHVIKDYSNICKHIHLPAQSGNSNVLERMRRGYTREAYLELVGHMRNLIPEVTLSSDFICGFCGETDEEFQDTLTLMDTVKYNQAFLYAYSMREKTTAHRRYVDDVPNDIKQKRLIQMSEMFRANADRVNHQQIGSVHLILVEGYSKRSQANLAGRNDANIKVIIPSGELTEFNGHDLRVIEPGDYIAVQINDANSQVLKGIPLYRTSVSEFEKRRNNSHVELIEFNSMM